MIARLEFMLNQATLPKVKSLLLDIAKLPENKQEDALNLIEILLKLTKK